jgi:hypothetical protein
MTDPKAHEKLFPDWEATFMALHLRSFLFQWKFTDRMSLKVRYTVVSFEKQ